MPQGQDLGRRGFDRETRIRAGWHFENGPQAVENMLAVRCQQRWAQHAQRLPHPQLRKCTGRKQFRMWDARILQASLLSELGAMSAQPSTLGERADLSKRNMWHMPAGSASLPSSQWQNMICKEEWHQERMGPASADHLRKQHWRGGAPWSKVAHCREPVQRKGSCGQESEYAPTLRRCTGLPAL